MPGITSEKYGIFAVEFLIKYLDTLSVLRFRRLHPETKQAASREGEQSRGRKRARVKKGDVDPAKGGGKGGIRKLMKYWRAA